MYDFAVFCVFAVCFVLYRMLKNGKNRIPVDKQNLGFYCPRAGNLTYNQSQCRNAKNNKIYNKNGELNILDDESNIQIGQ